MKTDLVIIGTGAAGYTASIYASRYKVDHIIVGELPGGVITESHLVENFPTEEGISGMELGMKIQKHAKAIGVKEIITKASKIDKTKDGFRVWLQNGETIDAKAVLLATGTISRKLNIPGEKEFAGKGVAYCATCDGFFYRDKIVAVVGGSDSANTAAVYLSDIAKHVYLIARGKELKGETAWIDQLKETDNVEILLNTNVIEAIGTDKLEKLKLDRKYKDSEYLTVDGLFIEIGADPAIQLAKDLGVELTKNNHIHVKDNQESSIPGFFAAGDLTDKSNHFKQVITACSEGAIAAESIFKYLKK